MFNWNPNQLICSFFIITQYCGIDIAFAFRDTQSSYTFITGINASVKLNAQLYRFNTHPIQLTVRLQSHKLLHT